MTWTVGQELEDEDGWRIVLALDPDGDGAWTLDKHGTERWERYPTQTFTLRRADP